MRTYLLVSFWLNVVAVLCQLLIISIGKYPRIIWWSIAEDVVRLVLIAVFGIWGAWLLWS